MRKKLGRIRGDEGSGGVGGYKGGDIGNWGGYGGAFGGGGEAFGGGVGGQRRIWGQHKVLGERWRCAKPLPPHPPPGPWPCRATPQRCQQSMGSARTALRLRYAPPPKLGPPHYACVPQAPPGNPQLCPPQHPPPSPTGAIGASADQWGAGEGSQPGGVTPRPPPRGGPGPRPLPRCHAAPPRPPGPREPGGGAVPEARDGGAGQESPKPVRNPPPKKKPKCPPEDHILPPNPHILPPQNPIFSPKIPPKSTYPPKTLHIPPKLPYPP